MDGRIKKGARITGPTRVGLTAEITHKYERGMSIRALAAETGRGYATIWRMLTDAGVPLRSKGGKSRM